MKLSKEHIERLREMLARPGQRIVVVSHTNPDGDAVGSSLAWAEVLRTMGHAVTCVVPNKYPYFLDWMPGIDEVVIFKTDTEGRARRAIAEADMIFCLDFNAVSRLEILSDTIEANTTARRVLIDHHLSPDEGFDLMFSHPDSSSTCFLVYSIVEAMCGAGAITRRMAESLYVGMMTDTGNFAFSFLTPELFRAVAMQNKINEVIMQAKIAELGIALTDEEAADAENDAQTDWDNAISNYISQQHSELTDESSQEDKDAANAEAVQYYNDLGYSPESLKENYKQYALYDKLEATIVQDVTVTDEEVEALYQELVESDRALYENDIAAYVDYNNYVDQMAMYAMYYGTDSSMDYAWYRPAGFRAVKHILLPVDDELMKNCSVYREIAMSQLSAAELEKEGV